MMHGYRNKSKATPYITVQVMRGGECVLEEKREKRSFEMLEAKLTDDWGENGKLEEVRPGVFTWTVDQ